MTNQHPLRVIIADDDYLAIAQIREVVELLGYVVAGVAADGAEAITLTQTHQPDVVLMDIRMSTIDGIEATRKIQEICPTPVVILTAFQDPELVRRANGAGVGAYLVKPPNPRELERTIAVAIARFADMQQLRRLNAELREEIAVRKRVEYQLNQALREKDVLLKEVHHRVKNNLQVITSLLYLQSQEVEHEDIRKFLQVSRDRIRSMAIVHEELYQAKDLANIEFSHYIRSLALYLYHAYAVNPDVIALRIDAQKIVLPVDKAIPCGLVLNEVISNALKYAFPDGRSGDIQIAFYEEHDRKWLRIRDNGIGLPTQVNVEHPTSLGLNLVTDLVRKQLQGTIAVDRTQGTTVTISFP